MDSALVTFMEAGIIWLAIVGWLVTHPKYLAKVLRFLSLAWLLSLRGRRDEEDDWAWRPPRQRPPYGRR
jgi:hypothetical protein